MDNTQILSLLFIVLLGFIYFESLLFFKVVKYLVEKIVLLKTFAAGLPVQEDAIETEPYVPDYPDEDFGEGKIAGISSHGIDVPEAQDEEFDEDLKPGDELKDVGI